MAQYDVYANPDPNTSARVPYLVDVQSRLLDRFSTRLMMPLLPFRAHAAGVPRRLMPRVLVQGEAFVVHAHQAAAVELRALGAPVASLAPQASELIGALDTVISGV
jgi:toxin CcdB